MAGLIYLDNAATTPRRPPAAMAMRVHLDAGFGNPSSLRWAARDRLRENRHDGHPEEPQGTAHQGA